MIKASHKIEQIMGRDKSTRIYTKSENVLLGHEPRPCTSFKI